MYYLSRRIIRVSGFVVKEIVEVVRQPRFMVLLIMGPFTILLLFGLGYVGDPGNLRAVLVVPNKLGSDQEVERYKDMFGTGNVQLSSITADRDEALEFLRREEVDVVVVLPAQAARQIGAGGQAQLQVLYNTIDPLRSGFIVLVTILYTNDLNKEMIAQAVQRSQGGASDIDRSLARIDAALARADANLNRSEHARAAERVQEARDSANMVQLSLDLLLNVLQTQPPDSTAPQSDPETKNLAEGEQTARDLISSLAALQDSLRDPAANPETIRKRIAGVRQDIHDLRGLTAQYAHISPYVLAAPFFGSARNLSPVAGLSGVDRPTNFYTPGALALLLQHMAVTLSSLSMVRERLRGSIEIFRVSPISPGEILLGKYLGFGLFLAVAVLALLLLLGFGLGTPMLGSYWWLAVLLGLLTWSSLSLGFAISMVSQSESQAVQIGMITLLGSVFFSGLLMRAETLAEPVRALSYALPVTHGLLGLQAIMLKGAQPGLANVVVLAGLGLVFTMFSLWRLRLEFRGG